MAKKGTSGIERGQAITFRLPSDTPDHLIKQLQELKETEKRNFSSKIAQFALDGVNQSIQRERETITIPLPKGLSKEQRNWIKHAHSEALLGNIVYQLLADPMRASSVLASLNSHSLDIDQALYLQEGPPGPFNHGGEQHPPRESGMDSGADESRMGESEFDDQLDQFDWNQAREEQASSNEDEEPEEESADDLLGGFLDRMNR
ncbi:hypothetical protein [Alteribacter aurantiacus]|uniref:hypothetical protein n=1 Tax=Alteribacter aurantiacus TaxID=254410 RepID=UPI00041059A8|nr:hypothetical protein [Alteribacter aurantiacus]